MAEKVMGFVLKSIFQIILLDNPTIEFTMYQKRYSMQIRSLSRRYFLTELSRLIEMSY
jgi:hypothetical protein